MTKRSLLALSLLFAIPAVFGATAAEAETLFHNGWPCKWTAPGLEVSQTAEGLLLQSPDATAPFGISLLTADDRDGSDPGATRSGVGPIRWMAPESIDQRAYSSLLLTAHGNTLDGLPVSIALTLTYLGETYAAALDVQGLNVDPQDVELRGYHDGNPVFEESGNTGNNPLFESSAPPSGGAAQAHSAFQPFADLADGAQPPPPPLPAGAGPGFVLVWDTPIELVRFNPDGVPTRAQVSMVQASLGDSGGPLVELNELAAQWTMAPGEAPTVLVTDVANGVSGSSLRFGDGAHGRIPADGDPDRPVVVMGLSNDGRGSVRTPLPSLFIEGNPMPSPYISDWEFSTAVEEVDAAGLTRTSEAKYDYDGALEQLVMSASSSVEGASIVAELEPADPVAAVIVREQVIRATVSGTPPPSSLPFEVLGEGMRYVVELPAPTEVTVDGESFPDIVGVHLRVEMGAPALPGVARRMVFSVVGPPGAELPIALAGQGIIGGPSGHPSSSQAVGFAHLAPAAGEQLWVGGLGPSAQSGVRLDFEPTQVTEMTIAPPAVGQRNQTDMEFLARLASSTDPAAPSKSAGLRLAAHELTHVVQANLSEISSSPEVTVQRWSGGVLVEEMTVPHGAESLPVSGTPVEMGAVVHAGSGQHQLWLAIVPAASTKSSASEVIVASAPAAAAELSVGSLELRSGWWPAMMVTGSSVGSSVAAPELRPASALRLLPARPNPFNPRTLVRFTVAQPGPTRLGVYDLRGRLVRTLHDGVLEPGEHELLWRGTDARGRAVASGTYLLRLSGGGVVETGKVVLVR